MQSHWHVSTHSDNGTNKGIKIVYIYSKHIAVDVKSIHDHLSFTVVRTISLNGRKTCTAGELQSVCGPTKKNLINVHIHFAALHIWPCCIKFNYS